MKDLTSDCLRLLNKVISDTYENYALIHLAQTEHIVFSYPSLPEIPTCYGYVVDATPLYLQKEGIIGILQIGHFVLKDYKSLHFQGVSKRGQDILKGALQLRYKKFTGNELNPAGYTFYTPAMKRINSLRGLYFVVVDRKKAEEYIAKNTIQSGSIVNAAKRLIADAEEKAKEQRINKVDELDERLKKLEQQSTKRPTSKQIVGEILKQYKFPKKQKMLIKKLISTLPKETEILKGEVGTGDLPSLKRDTLITITKFGLSKILGIKSFKGSFDKHFYQLEVNLPDIPQQTQK